MSNPPLLSPHLLSLSVAALAAATITMTPHTRADEPPPEVKTLTVSGAPFEVVIELDAVVAGTGTTPISIAPDEFTDLTVTAGVRHGATVEKGDTLISFDREPLERQIRDLERGTTTSEIAAAAARMAFLAAEASAETDLTSVRRTREESADDLAYFEETGRPLKEEAAHQSLKRAQFAVESAREELEQLTKMYEADDLTEETEEIILKRATQDFERAESQLVAAEANHARTLGTSLPREHQSLQVAAERAKLGAESTESTQPVTLAKLRNELATAEESHRESLEKLGRLRSDLRKFLVVAPAAGTVFFGHEESGSWPAAAALTKKLRPGGKIAPHEVAMTLVHAGGETALVAVVPEEKLSAFLEPGATGTARLKGGGDEATVKLASLDQAPLPGGGFEAHFTFGGENPPGWPPGRTAAVELDLYRNGEALAIPRAAIQRSGGKAVVTVLVGGEQVEREIQVGRTDRESVEVTGGLKSGEVLVLR